jgi:hypothetical protein
MKKADAVLVNHAMNWAGKKDISPHVIKLSKTRSATVLGFIVPALVFFFVLLLNIWIHTKIVDVGYRIGDLMHQKKILTTRNNDLNIEHDRILADRKLRKIARKRFHLSPLTLEQFIDIDEKN